MNSEKAEMLHDTLGLLDMDSGMSVPLSTIIDTRRSSETRMSGSFKSSLPAAAKGSDTWKKLYEVFQKAPAKSLTMVLVRDIAAAVVFMREEEELLKSKLAQVAGALNCLPTIVAQWT